MADFSVFESFKTNPTYQEILEHVTKEFGASDLEILQTTAPDLVAKIDLFKINDAVGKPTCFNYPAVGVISPTTLRSVKVAADLRRFFGSNLGSKLLKSVSGMLGNI